MSLSEPPNRPSFQPGQTLIFVGDHTSPDAPGYLLVIRDVLGRFFPQLNLNLISAGSKGQTPAGLRSQAMMDLLGSSRPDYLVIGVGLADAAREPAVGKLLEAYRKRVEERDNAIDETFGPEHQADYPSGQPISDSGRAPEVQLIRLARFTEDLAATITGLRSLGVNTILMTPALMGNVIEYPLNPVLHAYSKRIRSIGEQEDVPVVDVEKAFRDLFDRAANYKQKAILSGPEGNLNAQGQTLIARTFLGAFGLLPGGASNTGR